MIKNREANKEAKLGLVKAIMQISWLATTGRDGLCGKGKLKGSEKEKLIK